MPRGNPNARSGRRTHPAYGYRIRLVVPRPLALPRECVARYRQRKASYREQKKKRVLLVRPNVPM